MQRSIKLANTNCTLIVRGFHNTCVNFAAPAKSAVSTTGKKRFRLPPESTDAKFLVSHVSGLNYFKEGEPVQLKPDSEYPDWIWNLNLERPDFDFEFKPESKEFWEQVAYLDFVRKRRLLKFAMDERKVVGKNELRKLEWIERIKHRVLMSQKEDPGFDTSELKEQLNMQITLRPQVQNQTIYMDEIKLDK